LCWPSQSERKIGIKNYFCNHAATTIAERLRWDSEFLWMHEVRWTATVMDFQIFLAEYGKHSSAALPILECRLAQRQIFVSGAESLGSAEIFHGTPSNVLLQICRRRRFFSSIGGAKHIYFMYVLVTLLFI
jgi:hypothetical protein